MRSKKGFTLIELLAVIVILAIIALIAVPIILNMINDARKSAAVDSACGYIEAIEYQNSMNMLDKKHQKIEDGENIDVTTIDSLVKVKGTRPDSGTITIEKGRIVNADLCIDGFNVVYDGKKAKATDSTKCGSASESDEVEEVVIKDEVSCQLAKETIDDKEYLYIDSVEDMYAFSQSVNSGVDYQGKIVKLRNDLDFSSYKPEEKTSVCGISNENGFTPIGTSTKPFNGSFDGGGKFISNLTINKSSQNNIGLFGYVEGPSAEKKTEIYGLILKSLKITGNQYIGSIAGNIKNVKIYEIELNDINIYANNYASGILGGGIENSVINNILIKSGTIKTPNNMVAGIIYSGRDGDSAATNIIAENISIVGKYHTFLTNSSYNTYHSNGSQINGSNATSGYDANGVDDLNFYEAAGLDTWIGGDNDESGYYFDYDKDGKVRLKSTKTNPIVFNLSKDSKGNYLIKNETDWKQASLKNDKTYKLENSLDFNSKKYYMLGSSQNKFSGTLDGNNKTLKNITINGNREEYLGLIGYVDKGSVYELNINNFKTSGYKYVGILGYVTGTVEKNSNIYGIRMKNDLDSDENPKGKIVGNWYVGGVVGYVDTHVNIKEIELDNLNIYGNEHYIAGVVGFINSDTNVINNILIKTAIINGWNYTGYLSGNNDNIIKNSIVENLTFTLRSTTGINSFKTNSSCNTYHSNLIIHNEKPVTDGFDSKGIDDINFYETAGLDTWIGGDNDKSGYYFDYDENNKVVLKRTDQNPIIFNLSKDSNGVYLIKNEKDWKEASTKTDGKYKLTSDLDFSKNKYYMLGSNTDDNAFTGILNGNDKTISNVTISGSKIDYIGMIGKTNGATIYGLKLNKIDVQGRNYVGVFGAITGTENKKSNVYGIVMNGIKVDATNYYSGTVAGTLSYCNLKEIEIDDINITASNYAAGIIGGGAGNSDVNNILIKSGTITTPYNMVAGILYGATQGEARNVIAEKLTIKGEYYTYVTESSKNTYHSNACIINGRTNGTFSSSLIGDLDHYTGILETLYNGDKDGSGYFFDYVDDKNGIRLVKAYTPQEADTPTEKANCKIVYGTKTRGCYLYTSGVHGNYLYEGVPASETGTGATCTGTGRSPAYRTQISYNCS